MDGWMVPIDRIVEQHAWPVSFTFRLQQHLMSLANGTSEHPSAMDKEHSEKPPPFAPNRVVHPPPACLCFAVQPASKASCMHG